MCVYVRGMTCKCVYVFVYTCVAWLVVLFPAAVVVAGLLSISAPPTVKQPVCLFITAADRLAVCVGEGDSLWHAAVQVVCLQQAAFSGAWSQQTTHTQAEPRTVCLLTETSLN